MASYKPVIYAECKRNRQKGGKHYIYHVHSGRRKIFIYSAKEKLDTELHEGMDYHPDEKGAVFDSEFKRVYKSDGFVADFFTLEIAGLFYHKKGNKHCC